MKQTQLARDGLLIAHFGATAEVEDLNTGEIYRCHLRKNGDPVITGDLVKWQLEKDNTGIVISHAPRTSLLSRPENPKKTKLIAANVNAIIIVSAPPPILSEYLIDRYLVAAENLKIMPIVLLNKMDLLNDSNVQDIDTRLATYKKIGYQVITSCTLTKNGLSQLETFLKDKTCVLVGPSGVGKSSIIAKLSPASAVVVGQTAASGLGKHTTTSTRLYHLPQGGSLIDSPGVREFNLWHMSAEDISKGFPEIVPFLQNCKFRNCQHKKEQGCAVQQALIDKKIDVGRFNSYQEILKGTIPCLKPKMHHRSPKM